MINTTLWHEFRLGDIVKNNTFKIFKYNSIPENTGNIPFVSSSSVNNGVVNFVYANSIQKNCITISTNGNCFDCFYHDTNIAISSDVDVIYIENLNKHTALFLCTLLNKESFKWSYGRKPKNNKVLDTIIKLPAIKNDFGEFVPDWQYMENYIKSLKISLPKTKNKSQNKNIDSESWKEFKVGDLFTISLSTGDIKQGDCKSGNIPLISSGSTNNGVIEFIDESGDGIATIFDKNKITVDMFGQAFYQKYKFYSVSHGRVNILTLKNNNLNTYNALFICSIINNEQYRFSYNRAVYSSVIYNTIIKLPAIKNDFGEFVPDWKYMENYIKSLPYADLI